MTIEDYIAIFEKGLCRYIRENEEIPFNQSLYSIQKNADNDYLIDVTIPGLGHQQIAIYKKGAEINFRVKLVKMGSGKLKFPIDLFLNLHSSVMRLYYNQSPEDIAKDKALEILNNPPIPTIDSDPSEPARWLPKLARG